MNCDIITPTYDNPDYLIPFAKSVLRHTIGLGRLIIVNNGKMPLEEMINDPRVTIIKAGRNVGWEGGLKLGLKESKSEFVVFMNDDTYIPPVSAFWLMRLLYPFGLGKVGAVGPVTNCAAGLQNMFYGETPMTLTETSFLIGFCVALKRSILDEVGGVDDSLPGGDDFDLSIRLRKAGYRLLIQPSSFVYHHGFVTGTKVNGSSDKPMGWNSKDMTDRTNHALIVKHGFKTFWESFQGRITTDVNVETRDLEGMMIQELIKGSTILELGCGATKTVPNAVGIDIIPNGQQIPNLGPGALSVADIQADVSVALPLANASADTIIGRHVLEHCVDIVHCLKEWRRVLKPNGRLILAVPDEGLNSTIPMNPEHVHAFNQQSLEKILTLIGYRVIENKPSQNGVSFVIAAERGELC